MSPQQNSKATATTEPARVLAVRQESIRLADIKPREGFNPRTEVVRDREFDALVATIAQRGVLQPIRVSNSADGGYDLIAGERRYSAALQAGLTEIPAIIVLDEQDEASRLADAVIENDLRVGLNPLERARGYARLKEAGLTVKAISQQTGRSHASIRQHLQLLDLPEDLHASFADASIPLVAVAELRKLAQASPAAALALVAEVKRSAEDHEPWQWAEAVERPVEVLREVEDLPAGVYSVPGEVRLDGLDLDAKTVKRLDQIEKLTGNRPSAVYLHSASFAAAAALNATLGNEHYGLIFGADVVAQLAGDVLAAALKQKKEQHQRTTRLAEEAAARAAAADGDTPDPSQDEVDPAAAEAERKAQAAAERAQQQREREEACAFNDRLGLAIVDKLSRVKLDVDAVRVLTTVDFADELGDIALRGARYGFPGWVTEEATKGGKLKRTYLQTSGAAEVKAREYLAGAKTPGEHAGRSIALVVMAWFADERAVAQSNRSFKSVRPGGMPWADDVAEILERYALAALPGDERLQALVAQRAEAREEAAAAAARRADARAVVAVVTGVEDPAQVTTEQLDAAEAALPQADYSYMEDYTVQRKLKEIRALLETPAAKTDPETGDEPGEDSEPGSDG